MGFKVGDLIKGTQESDRIYSVTNSKMYIAEVFYVNGSLMRIKILNHSVVNNIGCNLEVSNNDLYFELINQESKMEEVKMDKVIKDSDEKVFNFKRMIKRVVYNNPATIVFWKDGTKTVVKVINEDFDKEKGLAMAIVRKMSGNKFGYYDVFKRWC